MRREVEGKEITGGKGEFLKERKNSNQMITISNLTIIKQHFIIKMVWSHEKNLILKLNILYKDLKIKKNKKK